MGIDPGTFQLVAYCFNHHTTPGPNYTLSLSLSTKITQQLTHTPPPQDRKTETFKPFPQPKNKLFHHI
jgi:hypothetical protein